MAVKALKINYLVGYMEHMDNNKLRVKTHISLFTKLRTSLITFCITNDRKHKQFRKQQSNNF